MITIKKAMDVQTNLSNQLNPNANAATKKAANHPNVSYFALSGQDERSKYCGVLTVGSDIFILNTGIGWDINNQYGISKIIPDLNYLSANKNKVKGIFLGTPKNLNIGALPFFLEVLGDVPIYTTQIGATIITTWFQQKRSTEFNKANLKPNIQIIKSQEWIQFAQTKVCGFKVFNSMPDSLGYVFQTSLGSVVWVDEFMVGSDQLAGFSSELHLLPKLTNYNVLTLIVGLQNTTDNNGFAAPNYDTKAFIQKAVANWPQRVIVSCYEHDLLTIKNIISIAQHFGLKLFIYSKTMTRLVQQMVKMRYLDLRGVNWIQAHKINYDPNSIIIVSGNYDRLYHKMHKIINREDTNFRLNDHDQYVLATVVQPGLEIQEARLLDAVARTECHTQKMPAKIILPTAGLEDHKLLVTLTQPKYILPVYGFYKEYINYSVGVSKLVHQKNMKFLDNGETAHFSANGPMKITKQKVDDSYVNISGIVDIGTSILLERQALYNFGLITISLLYDETNCQFSRPKIYSKGLISTDHFKNESINSIVLKLVQRELLKALGLAHNHQVNLKQTKIQIKKVVLRAIEQQIQKSPLVIVNIGGV